jgi:hypothetical protein
MSVRAGLVISAAIEIVALIETTMTAATHLTHMGIYPLLSVGFQPVAVDLRLPNTLGDQPRVDTPAFVASVVSIEFLFRWRARFLSKVSYG